MDTEPFPGIFELFWTANLPSFLTPRFDPHFWAPFLPLFLARQSWSEAYTSLG
jgi:hypothetical protein